MWTRLRDLLGLLLLLQPALADTDDQTSADVDRGSFLNPAARVRPRFRYWLPDAGVDIPTVQRDIKSAGAIGAGGVEFLPYFNYGGQLSPPPNGSNWTRDGFGTPAYRKMFTAALQAHQEAGLAMDFALGPNQGQGVPAEYGDEGLQWDLEPFSVSIPKNGSFEGKLPGWGTGKLVALVSAEVLSTKKINLPGGGMTLFGTPQSSYQQLTLRNGSLTEWTEKVSSSGYVSLQLAARKSTAYRLFAFYEFLSHEKNLDYASDRPRTIFDNGSYAVDHFSARGAQTTIKFWEKYILTDKVKELLREVGNYGWEDSMEIRSNISWTPSLPQLFQSIHGYALKPILPLIMFGDNNINIQSSQPGAIQCILDTPDRGLGHVYSFRDALVQGYRNYLKELTNWMNSKLDLQMSAQVSYNLPMDMEANVPFVNAPECESLQFVDNIDGYRQFSGPANLAGKRVISNEMGAVMLKAYSMPHSELLASINRAVVGGVNQVVLHGQSYTGNYHQTTWPGYTAFMYLFSELYSEKQPSWLHGFGDVLNYVARVQYIQQSGVPRTDVALYNKVSATNPNFPTMYSSKDLTNAGYTYTYLSPDNFALPEAKVQNGTLGPNGPAYKALVITSNNNLTLEGVHHIQRYARAGLPVILSGGDPGVYATPDGRDTPAVKKAIQGLKDSRNVYSVAAGNVAAKLQTLNLQPRVAVQTNGTWYSTWREDASHGTDHAFVFCENNASNGNVSVASAKTPFFLNPWTGEKKPVLHYRRQGERVVIPLRLASNQTVVIGFTDDGPGLSEHITHMPSSVVGYDYAANTGAVLHISASDASQSVLLSNGTRVSLQKTNITPARSLANWTLTAEHWEAPQNLSNASVVAAKHNATHRLSSLRSWTHIKGLEDASGVGYYQTTFTWSGDSAEGAYLELPTIAHAARVVLNGQSLPPVDLAAPRADLALYLQPGLNQMTVVVPTTMWNYIRSIADRIENAGVAVQTTMAGVGQTTLPPRTKNGLMGTVWLVPYVKQHLAL